MPLNPLPDFKAFLTEGTPIDPTGYHEYKIEPIVALCTYLKSGGNFLFTVKQESQFKALAQILKAAQEAQPGVAIGGGWTTVDNCNSLSLSKPSGRFRLQYFGDMASNVSEIWTNDRQLGKELAANQAAIDLF